MFNTVQQINLLMQTILHIGALLDALIKLLWDLLDIMQMTPRRDVFLYVHHCLGLMLKIRQELVFLGVQMELSVKIRRGSV